MADIKELHIRCMICKREIPDGTLFYRHPKFGIVCEVCPQFRDGGVEIDEEV